MINTIKMIHYNTKFVWSAGRTKHPGVYHKQEGSIKVVAGVHICLNVFINDIQSVLMWKEHIPQ